jgi:hypothetical protein
MNLAWLELSPLFTPLHLSSSDHIHYLMST